MVSRMASLIVRVAFQPSSRSAFDGSANTFARSPGLLSTISYGKGAWLTFSKASIISSTEVASPVPRLYISTPGFILLIAETWPLAKSTTWI